jgi:hypothetical protein
MPSEENKSKEQRAAESEVESFRKDLGPESGVDSRHALPRAGDQCSEARRALERRRRKDRHACQAEPTPRSDRMRLRWQESGGPVVTPPGRKGFGSRLIEGGLAQDLCGEAAS